MASGLHRNAPIRDVATRPIHAPDQTNGYWIAAGGEDDGDRISCSFCYEICRPPKPQGRAVPCQRYRDSTGRHETEFPWPPWGIDPATASHEDADANVPTGFEPGGAKLSWINAVFPCCDRPP